MDDSYGVTVSTEIARIIQQVLGFIPNFAEVYLQCSLEVCIRRESKSQKQFPAKDIYARSKKEGATVPRVNIHYEELKALEIIVDPAPLDINQAVEEIVKRMEELFL